MLDIKQVIQILGGKLSEPSLRKQVEALGIDLGIVKIRSKGEELNLISKNKLIEITYSDPELFDIQETSNDSEFIISTIFLSPGSEILFSSLPCDLNFHISFDLVQKKLGEPVWKSPVGSIFRWNQPDYWLTLRFSKEDLKLQRIICSVAKI